MRVEKSGMIGGEGEDHEDVGWGWGGREETRGSKRGWESVADGGSTDTRATAQLEMKEQLDGR